MGALLAGATVVGAGSLLAAPAPAAPDAKGLPTVLLGNTGVRIPRVAFGLGSRFCTIEKDEDAYALLNHALDNGLYYWDTACIYDNQKLGISSEGRIGEVVRTRRSEVFLSTKVSSRTPDLALRDIARSLKRLQTDRLDMLKIHSVDSLQDVAKLSEKGNLIDIVHRLKAEGVTRFVGFSGHADADAMKAMADRGDFDSMLIALNHYNKLTKPQPRESVAIPAAKARGLGVMVMKVVRPRETTKGLDPRDLIRFALSLPGPDGAVLGMESRAVMDANLELLRGFKPLDPQRMQQLAQQLIPFYEHKDLPWMRSGYSDGMWA
jgi:aryl-alcohol dehydrogenase-like predicted oxidoreductase